MKLDYDVTSPTFKYVESLWFKYNDMIRKMRDIEMDCVQEDDDNRDIKAQGLTSDPTSAQYFKLQHARDNKQYQTLEVHVQVIEDVFNALPDDYRAVARSRYFTRHAKRWCKIAQETGYSERHARRIRDMIVVATAEKLGLW